MWKLDFAKTEDLLFIKQLDQTVRDEITQYFSRIVDTFGSLNRSVMCNSIIYSVESYNVKNQNLFINYHVDSDEEFIRITSIDVN